MILEIHNVNRLEKWLADVVDYSLRYGIRHVSVRRVNGYIYVTVTLSGNKIKCSEKELIDNFPLKVVKVEKTVRLALGGTILLFIICFRR